MPELIHEIWKDRDGLTMLCLAGKMGDEARRLMPEGSELIGTISAKNHFDAMTIYYRFMGWGVYSTEFEIDKQEYSDEWKKIQEESV